MSIIKIYAEGRSIDFVKESLTIKEENNSMITDFKVAHSSVPFLVVEDENTKIALGTRDLTSVNRKKVIPVTVSKGGDTYYGELQTLSYLNGFRKCNLKFASDLLKVSNRKIGEFLPVISVIPGETNPVPFSETVSEPIALQGWWAIFHRPVQDKCFPEAMYNFPKMEWRDKYEITEDETEDWHNWQGFVNNQDDENFLRYNEVYNVADGRRFDNNNVIAPQVFLLSPLKFILDSIGYKLEGTFPNSEFVKRLLMLSFKDNMSEISSEMISINLQDYPVGDGKSWLYYMVAEKSGNYEFTIKGKVPDAVGGPVGGIRYALGIGFSGTALNNVFFSVNREGIDVDTTFNLTVLPSQIGQNIAILYNHQNGYFMEEFSMKIQTDDYNTGFQANTTVDFSRYVPEWTVTGYINEMKNLFNLDVIIDDFKKKMIINFNENEFEESEVYVIEKSLAVKTYEPAESLCYLLKYANEEDDSLWIEKNEVSKFTNQISDFSKTISSKFKFVPNNTVTAVLSEDLKDKEGVGLMIYDPARMPYVSKSFENQTLEIMGEYGIYQLRWKKWLKFRLNASVLEISAPFTETELSKLLRVKKIYVDRQLYMVSSFDYSETKEGNMDVKIKVESLIF